MNFKISAHLYGWVCFDHTNPSMPIYGHVQCDAWYFVPVHVPDFGTTRDVLLH